MGTWVQEGTRLAAVVAQKLFEMRHRSITPRVFAAAMGVIIVAGGGLNFPRSGRSNEGTAPATIWSALHFAAERRRAA